MRAERRTAGGAPPNLLARHAAEVEGLAIQLATLKASSLSAVLFITILVSLIHVVIIYESEVGGPVMLLP